MNLILLKITLYLPPPHIGNVKKSIGYLLYLRFKANLHSEGEYKDTPLAMKYVLEALRFRRPDFAVDDIPNYFLAHDEFLLINTMAVIVRDLEGLPAAIEIWQKLKDNYDRDYAFLTKDNIAYNSIVMNIALALKMCGRYEECLSRAEEGYKISLEQHDMRSFSRYLYLRAFCKMKLGQRDEGRALYKRFLMLAYVLDRYARISFDTVKKEYEDEFSEASPVDLA